MFSHIFAYFSNYLRYNPIAIAIPKSGHPNLHSTCMSVSESSGKPTNKLKFCVNTYLGNRDLLKF
jgi:hypothetical protein